MQVSSLKEAILISLEKYGYDLNNKKIVEKIIQSALDGKAKNITRHNGAQQYIINQGKEKIIEELSKFSNSNDIDVIIDDYIKNAFKKKEINADLNRIKKIIKSLNLSVENDDELMDKTWDYFLNVFENKNENFSKEELKECMVVAALKQVEVNRDNAQILSTPNLLDKKLTLTDALNLVEKYIYEDKEEELMSAIDNNPYLSGNLLNNLLDYVYFEKQNFNTTNKIDDYFIKMDLNINQKVDILKNLINNNNINPLDVSKNEIIIEMIKNSLYLNIYSSSHKGIEYEERRLYTGEDNVTTESVQKIIEANNNFLYPYLENGLNQDIDEIYNNIININEKNIDFLCNLYIRSRCDLKNIKMINEIKGITTSPEKSYIIGLLEDNNLIKKLDSSINKVG